MRTLALSFTILTPLLAVPTFARQDAQEVITLEYEALAKKWLTDHEVSATKPEDIDFGALLDEQFVQFRLGVFELRIPAESFTDGASIDTASEVCRAVLSAQREWLRWLQVEPGKTGVPKEIETHIKTLDKWIESWKEKEVSVLGSSPGQELISVVAPKAKVAEAATAFAEFATNNGPLTVTDEGLKALPKVVLFPDRGPFLEAACLAGWVHPDLRSVYWADNLSTWTNLDVNGVRFLALQFADPGSGDYKKGVPIGARNPRALSEHIAQLAGRSLFESAFGDKMDPILGAGLSNNLVIDIFEEVDTRTDGDLRSRSTQARSVFVPGGNPNGGSLPPVDAKSRWRVNLGEGYFIKELHDSQKTGGKQAKSKEDKLRMFQIENDLSQRMYIKSPFLGPHAWDDSSLDESYRGDYIEFLRAYRCGFLSWLRLAADGKEKDSRETFAKLLDVMAKEAAIDFPSALQKVYGVAMSTPDHAEDDLEGRFLAWLAKQK